MRMVTPFELQSGCASAEAILDLWCHALLGERWAAIVKRVEFSTTPHSMQLVGG